jgi:hypothetical protein
VLIQGFSIRSIAVRASGTAAVATDEYFNLVALLLPGNGTNGAQNNTFLDSSTNNFTVTRNGNTTQGTFSPFSQTGWSGYFDGTGDYLSTPNAAALRLGAGDFTVEAWIYPNRLTNTYSQGICGTYGYVSTQDRGWLFYLDAAGYLQLIMYGSAGAGFTLTSSTLTTINTWSHVAATRSGTTVRLFLNGVQVASGTSSKDEDYTVVDFNVATSRTDNLSPATGNPGTSFQGSISNLRLVKGTAVYTSAFTPPTAPLTAISGTSILTCQSNRFIDNSTNAFALTVNGNTSVEAFAPFDPTAAYDITTIGGSGYFDGTGDYLSVADNAALDLGSSDFTIEAWIYMRESDNYTIYAKRATSAIYGGILFIIDTAGGPVVYATFNGSSWGLEMTGYSRTCNLYSWNHVALTRSGSTWTTWVNGVAAQTGTNSGTVPDNTAAMTILAGAANGDFIGGPGYLSSWRLVKGTAVYTAAFTPPTAPVTAIANTSLLLNYTNAGITDATAKNVLETVGNAGISTTQSKWGGSAMAFDGSGDYLTFPITPLITSLGPTYTIEAWIYLANTTGVKTIYSTSIANVANYAYFIFYVNGSSLGFYTRAATGGAETGIVAGTLSANTWTHVAISVNSNSGRLYVNGIQVGSTTTINTTTFTPVYNTIGADILQGYNFNGYINDLRITPGVARYTANFTAPITAFPTQ